MPSNVIFVLCKVAAKLRGAFNEMPDDTTVHFIDDLSTVHALAEEHAPTIALIYKDTGFDGPELRWLSHYPSVKWLHVAGSGYDFLNPLERHDFLITNAQGLRSRNLAETVTGAMVALNAGLFHYRAQQKERSWAPREFVPLEGQRLLIVGTGAIGQWVAHNAKALGMHITGVNRAGCLLPEFDDAVAFDDLASALPMADVVSIHLRHLPETDKLFNAKLFGQMKPGAMFINTARGGIVNEPDLCKALTSGQIGSAYLDVFAMEPLPEDSPLWTMENVLVTPHSSDMIQDWDIKAARFFVSNLERYVHGDEMINVVQPPK